MLRAGTLGLLAASLVSCGPGYKKLKVDAIQSITVGVADPGKRMCAYLPAALRVQVTYRNGKQAQSRAAGERQRGRLRTSEFAWAASHGTIDGEAVLSLPADTFAWLGQPIRVTAKVIARPDIVGEATLEPTFACSSTVYLRGSAGARGGEAEPGGPGEPGPEAHVALGYIDTENSGRLVLVRIQSPRAEREHWVLDTREPPVEIFIDAGGGDGGRGGQGVMGVDGRPGTPGHEGTDGGECADGTPGENGTDGEPGGPGGPGANGGRGGDGGRVFVRYDGRFPELAEVIRVRVEAGKGGAAGPGGPGGAGGQGGKGGVGGKGGSDAAATCRGADGPGGTDGATGARGSSGTDGEAGEPGKPGEVLVSAAEVAELFADEIARGIPVVTGAD